MNYSYKKRVIALVFSILMLLSLFGCKSKIKNMNANEALLLVNGEVIMTVGEFRHLIAKYSVSHDILGTETIKEEMLFIQQAELYIMAYTAAQAGLTVEYNQLEEEFENHMAEIQDTDVYGNQLLYSVTLQEALVMDDAAYKKWTIEQSLKEYQADALLQDIASVYANVKDGEVMREYLQQHLMHLTSFYNIEIRYPGVNSKDLTFETHL